MEKYLASTQNRAQENPEATGILGIPVKKTNLTRLSKPKKGWNIQGHVIAILKDMVEPVYGIVDVDNSYQVAADKELQAYFVVNVAVDTFQPLEDWAPGCSDEYVHAVYPYYRSRDHVSKGTKDRAKKDRVPEEGAEPYEDFFGDSEFMIVKNPSYVARAGLGDYVRITGIDIKPDITKSGKVSVDNVFCNITTIEIVKPYDGPALSYTHSLLPLVLGCMARNVHCWFDPYLEASKYMPHCMAIPMQPSDKEDFENPRMNQSLVMPTDLQHLSKFTVKTETGENNTVKVIGLESTASVVIRNLEGEGTIDQRRIVDYTVSVRAGAALNTLFGCPNIKAVNVDYATDLLWLAQRMTIVSLGGRASDEVIGNLQGPKRGVVQQAVCFVTNLAATISIYGLPLSKELAHYCMDPKSKTLNFKAKWQVEGINYDKAWKMDEEDVEPIIGLADKKPAKAKELIDKVAANHGIWVLFDLRTQISILKELILKCGKHILDIKDPGGLPGIVNLTFPLPKDYLTAIKEIFRTTLTVADMAHFYVQRKDLEDLSPADRLSTEQIKKEILRQRAVLRKTCKEIEPETPPEYTPAQRFLDIVEREEAMLALLQEDAEMDAAAAAAETQDAGPAKKKQKIGFEEGEADQTSVEAGEPGGAALNEELVPDSEIMAE